jgi:hypothetical protein
MKSNNPLGYQEFQMTESVGLTVVGSFGEILRDRD